MLVQLVAVHRAPERRVFGNLVTDDEQQHVLEFGRLLAQQVKRLDQPLEVFMGLDVACVEHERPVELVPLAHEPDGLRVGLLPEAVVNRVVNDIDAGLGYAEVAEDVAFRCLGDCHDTGCAVGRRPHLAAHIRIPEAAWQILRESQMDAVVNGDDRTARGQRRQHVMRRMEQLDCLASDVDRDRELLADRVRASVFDDGPELRTERVHRVAVVRLAENDVLVTVVLPRELTQQIADVGADAVVAQLSRVDRDSHERLLIEAFPFEPHVQPQKRHEPWMVFLIERKMAAAVCGLALGGTHRPGPSAQMHDLGGRRKQDAPAEAANRVAEVHVFGVQKKAFVEQSDRFGISPAHEQACAAHPIDRLFLRRLRFDPCASAALLQELVQRRDHAAERQLRPAGAVHQPGPGDADVADCMKPLDEQVDGAARHNRVAVQQQQQIAAAFPDARIVRRREAGIPPQRQHAYAVDRAGSLDAPVARSVVDDDDLVVDCRRSVARRPQACEEIGPRVEAHDDDREMSHCRAIRSSPARVMSAVVSHE